MDEKKNIIVKRIENLYVHNRTGKLRNMIRHVKSHTNSSVTDRSLASLEEFYKKKSLIPMPRVPISKNVPLLSCLNTQRLKN